jgi:hypothetical protein
VDAVAAGLNRSSFFTSSYATLSASTTVTASTYRINHILPSLISDPDSTFFGVANPLIQGGGQKLLTHVDGSYSDYSKAIQPYKNKRIINVEGIKKETKHKKDKKKK